MKEYFKNMTLKKICSLITALVFVAIMIVMMIESRGALGKVIRSVGKKNAVELKNELDSTYNDSIFRKYDYIDLYGLGANIMDMREINKVIKLNNGYLGDIPSMAEYDALDAVAMSEFKAYLDDKGIGLLYIQAPVKGGERNPQLPYGKCENIDFLLDSLKTDMEGYGVPFIDMRAELENEGIDIFDAMYKTDHHWTTDTAFFAYTKLVDYLNANMDTGIDSAYTDISNYDKRVYEDVFLGSYGKRVGRYFAGMDDYVLITPKESIDSHIVMEIPSKKLIREGNFKEALLYMDNRLEYGAAFENNPYSVYTGGNYPLVKIKNESADCDKKILMVLDSSGIPLQSFLSLAVKELDAIDLRWYHLSSLADYIDATEPDIVVFCYASTRLFDKTSFDFFNITGEGING